jgi:hypothetical protein
MKKIFAFIITPFCCLVCAAQNVGINTTSPQAYGHGGTNRVLELKNDAGTGSDFQSHLILSTTGTAGSLGSLTWAAPNIPGAEKRTALIANVFETANATRLAFYTRIEAGSVTEKFSINGNGNVGIGTSTAGFPLNFASTLGDKISLYGNSGNHYGFGIQGALLQMHTDAAAANISFGYGSSGSFTERVKIINSGTDGMILNGRLLIKNGSVPLDINQTGGVWLYKADNTSLLGFMGTQNNQNIGFYGGPAGWGFTYDAINSRVGIGNNNPNAPLAFPPSFGKKITLYPGATGDIGFGVTGNRLQIYSDNPNADVAIGYDAAGTFNERFAVKPNGALAVNGSTGNAGQLLQSNGNGNAAVWSSLGSILPLINTSGDTPIIGGNNTTAIFSGSSTMNITVTQNTKVLIFCDVMIAKDCTIGPCQSACDFEVILDNAFPAAGISTLMGTSWPTRFGENKTVGPFIVDLTPGSHTISYRGFVSIGAPLWMILKATALLIKQ